MDEITVDMDVLGRQELLAFFARECELRGATIVYATHIFDGLEAWVTHVAYLEDGALKVGGARSLLPGLARGEKLLRAVEAWLRGERDARHAREAAAEAAGGGGGGGDEAAVVPTRTPFDVPSRHLAFFR